MTIVLQKSDPGLYASDLINGQFQVIQSTAVKSDFFIYDHKKDDILRNRDQSTVYFSSAAEGHSYLNDKAVVVKTTKVAKVKVAKVKAEKLVKALVVTSDVRPRKERKGSVLSTIRALIAKGGDDQSVYAELKIAHPDTTYGLKTVVILRAEMGA